MLMLLSLLMPDAVFSPPPRQPMLFLRYAACLALPRRYVFERRHRVITRDAMPLPRLPTPSSLPMALLPCCRAALFISLRYFCHAACRYAAFIFMFRDAMRRRYFADDAAMPMPADAALPRRHVDDAAFAISPLPDDVIFADAFSRHATLRPFALYAHDAAPPPVYAALLRVEAPVAMPLMRFAARRRRACQLLRRHADALLRDAIYFSLACFRY